MFFPGTWGLQAPLSPVLCTPQYRCSLLFLEFILIPKGTKQLEHGGLGRHTQRESLEMLLLRWAVCDLCEDGQFSLPPHWGGLLSMTVEFCCWQPDVSGTPALLLDHSHHWPQPGYQPPYPRALPPLPATAWFSPLTLLTPVFRSVFKLFNTKDRRLFLYKCLFRKRKHSLSS